MKSKILTAALIMSAIGAGSAYADSLATTNYVKGGLATKQNKVEATAMDEGKVLKIDAAGNVVLGTDNDTSQDISGKQDLIGDGTAGTVITNTGVAGTVGSLTIDTAVTAASTNLVTSGAVDTAVSGVAGSVSTLSGTVSAIDGDLTTLEGTVSTLSGTVATKQNMIGGGTLGTVITNTGTNGTVGSLAIDAAVTAASTNLVTSGAVDSAIATVNGQIAGLTAGAANTINVNNGDGTFTTLSVDDNFADDI